MINSNSQTQLVKESNKFQFNVYVALVHAPILNKLGLFSTSSITNYDIHDIARACRTYNVLKYGLISPDDTQLKLAKSICDHWTTGAGASVNPDRKEALSTVDFFPTLQEFQAYLIQKHGQLITLLTRAGGALAGYPQFSFQQARENWCLASNTKPILLVFGTGWGLAPSLWPLADGTLDAIRPPQSDDEYNHLSVRSAVSICLDRLIGDN